ncbi:hypothetical protein Nepgr_002161 [Nepenthes gracilis]|uniref:Uncharacterized protein n=1 Tax=Nepenthes gracilis TaxID=150966 RepID=A0AAD3P9M7_NEPGR|nr:hypothetical protein Nepgr_002161 [Nepenthes gracilis]
MKLFSLLIVTVLLLQAFTGALSFSGALNSLGNVEGGYESAVMAIHKSSGGRYIKNVPIKINCNVKCGRRCSRASREKVCKRACGACCMRCLCVPAGTFGNKDACPCYAGLKTHGGRSKCP